MVRETDKDKEVGRGETGERYRGLIGPVSVRVKITLLENLSLTFDFSVEGILSRRH